MISSNMKARLTKNQKEDLRRKASHPTETVLFTVLQLKAVMDEIDILEDEISLARKRLGPAGFKLLQRLNFLENQVAMLFDAIKHGDDKHQEWLKAAIKNHFTEAKK